MKYVNGFVGLVLGMMCAGGHVMAMPGASSEAVEISGVVAESMEGGRYTYIRVDAEDYSAWVAATHVEVKAGDRVTARGATIMENFESPSLNRTFDSILFADVVEVNGETSAAVSKPKLPAGHPVAPSGGAHGMIGGDGRMHQASGTVVETMNVGNYTYVLIDTGDGTLWAVTDQFEVKPGDAVKVPGGMMAENFESPSLGRTFEKLLFANAIEVVSGDTATSAPESPSAASASAPEVVDIAPPEGGLSVAELHRRRAELAGQTVTVRGKVTKYTERVLGRNWLHIIDGTADGAVSDLTISSADRARVGDVVTATGTVVVDEDLGYGYQYEVLLKDAELAPE